MSDQQQTGTQQSKIGKQPYERDVDEHRQFDVECLTCGESARLHCYPDRDWPWKHDMVNGDHVVEYQRLDDADGGVEA